MSRFVILGFGLLFILFGCGNSEQAKRNSFDACIIDYELSEAERDRILTMNAWPTRYSYEDIQIARAGFAEKACVYLLK
jgi:uncharacterized lipoprotein YehR (DUF1307 family)